MQQRILEGDGASIHIYIQDFIVKHKVPPFGITSFSTTAKIADILYIQKVLSRKSSHPLLFIFYADITHEAQNALLKTLEELPEYAYMFFCVTQASELLPTICSRAKVISLGFTSSKEDETVDDLVHLVCEKSSIDRLVLGERLLEKFEKDKEYGSLLHAFHRALINNASYRVSMYRILSALASAYPLTRSNNISFKMTLDMALLSA